QESCGASLLATKPTLPPSDCPASVVLCRPAEERLSGPRRLLALMFAPFGGGYVPFWPGRTATPVQDRKGGSPGRGGNAPSRQSCGRLTPPSLAGRACTRRQVGTL